VSLDRGARLYILQERVTWIWAGGREEEALKRVASVSFVISDMRESVDTSDWAELIAAAGRWKSPGRNVEF